MSNGFSAPITRLLALAVSLICLCVLPASGQQTVGAGFFGGAPPCIAGSNTALIDHNHNGPTADDLPAYFETGGASPMLTARFPTEGCFSEGSNQFPIWEATSGNPWPGSFNSINNIAGGFFEANMANQNGDLIGGTFYQGFNSYAVGLLPAPGRAAVYDRVQASGGTINLVGGIQGWDLDPQDGTPDYIGLSWAGLTAIGSCPDHPDLDDTMMLWVPVKAYEGTGGEPGAVTIQFDLNCDGVADSGYPSPPAIVPEDTVPVGLQSFSIAALLPSSPGGYALAILFCAVPIGALRLARRWLVGSDS